MSNLRGVSCKSTTKTSKKFNQHKMHLFLKSCRYYLYYYYVLSLFFKSNWTDLTVCKNEKCITCNKKETFVCLTSITACIMNQFNWVPIQRSFKRILTLSQERKKEKKIQVSVITYLEVPYTVHCWVKYVMMFISWKNKRIQY